MREICQQQYGLSVTAVDVRSFYAVTLVFMIIGKTEFYFSLLWIVKAQKLLCVVVRAEWHWSLAGLVRAFSTTWLTDLKWASSVVVLVLAVCYSPASLQLMLYNKVVCFLYAVVLFICACTYIGTAADLSAECLLWKPMYTLLKCFLWTCSSTKSHVYTKYCRHIFSDQKPYAVLVLQYAELCTP